MPPTPSTVLRQILTPSFNPLFKTPYLPLLARPSLKIPHTLPQLSHLRPSLLQTAFAGSRRTFSTSPATPAKVSDFANGFRSIETNAWRDNLFKEKAFLREEQRRKEKDRSKAEKLLKHEECKRQMHAYKSRIRQYLLRVYRRHFRFSSHRSHSSSWRPARLCFRTPNLSGAFRSRKRCDYTGKESKLCPKLLYALMDERRRYHPQRAAHFRHLVKIVQSEVAIHYARGSKQGCVGDSHAFHQRWCPKRGLRERFEAELRFGSHGGVGGGGECYKGTYKGRFRKHQHQQSSKDHDFDYTTFRKAYWYSRTHSHSRPYNHHREWTRRKHRMMWARPQEWVMKKDTVMRRRFGSAFITYDQCSKAREVHGVHGRGGNGGIARIRGIKINSVRLESPRSLRQFHSKLHSSLHHHSVRPRLSIPTSTPASLFSQVRLFSSSRPRSGLHFIVPLAAALKSTEALHLLVWITRLSLTLLPLSVRAKAIFALRERYLRDPSSLTATIWSRLASTYYSGSLAQPSGLISRFNAFWGLPLLLISPFILLALVGFASLERTPVTGRWRFVMLSPAEESELVNGILDIGRIASPTTTSHVNNGEITPNAPEGTSLDWITVLRQVLSLPDEGVDPETGRRMLLGGVVLDQRDWRVRWSEAVLRALEKGVVEGLTREGAGARGEGEALRPPPSKWPLEGRSMDQSSWKEELILSKHLDGHGSFEGKDGLKVEYDILVIDRDENNAFSFGFGPEKSSHHETGRRGVIVLYTGFLKEVLGETMQPSPSTSTSPQPNPTRLTSFFSRPSNVSPSTPEPDPIASYLVPSTLPTQEQCKSLAVLLSHETAHLILSHTLESYASMNLLMPHLSRLASDVLRTLLYPLTAFLGPFINDAVGRSLSEGAKGGFGILGHAANSCESRKLESEADLVALRLLAGSGIDPRFALDFWEDRLSTSPTTSQNAPATSLPNSVHQHSKNPSEAQTGMLEGYMRTHPVDRERLDKIREELKSWEEWNQQNKREAVLA